ncbi:MIP/aquaporin family protein [Aquirufa sp. 2-AUSEE-184A6]|jgi:glycerol uptake facilitator protein|uniref:MIP/aquaporin family protein n=1 Tax=Aquirufa novilacunae TaxID=3139305 RepID=A0ABW8SVZ8_9BACT
MSSIFIGELAGTATLLYLGNGVVANMLLKDTKGSGTGLLAIAAAWAFAVTIAIYVSTYFGSSGAHLNPIVTIAGCVKSGDWSLFPTFIGAQLTGAMLGQLLVWLHYKPHYDVTTDKGAILATFSTGPAIKNTPFNFISEAFASAIAVVALGTFSTIETGLGPFLVGILVWAIGLGLGGTTGYAINPARDLGPRIMHAILPIPNKGDSGWEYAWIPVVGPAAGAVLGAYILTLN